MTDTISHQLEQLAAGIAAWSGVSEQRALTALRHALTSEAQPFKRFEMTAEPPTEPIARIVRQRRRAAQLVDRPRWPSSTRKARVG